MSNPSPVHESDHPVVSTGSPLLDNRAESPSSVPNLKSSVKEEEPVSSECSSPKINGSSGGSSPTASTPPANGILTPPIEVDNPVCDTGKQEKPSGRLKFYKDGVLCLELSHHNEGKKTKWVQIRTKTVFPTVIHTTKEATIPCHVSPTSFASPSATSTLQSRVESLTSHSMSDDGSSMLSSPRLRENTWKQPVPQKGISSCLEFFFKPAVCVFNLRQKLFKDKDSKSQILKLNRKPYDCQIFTTVIQKSNFKFKSGCSCHNGDDTISKEEEDDDTISKNGDIIVDGNLNIKPPCTKKPHNLSNGFSIVKNLRTQNTEVRKAKVSVQVITERLKLEREQQKLKENLYLKVSQSNCVDSKLGLGKNQNVLPKKRAFREMDSSKDLLSNVVRPKKKSPNRNNDNTKTILNVPGLNSEFYRRHSIPLEAGGQFGQQNQQKPQNVVGELKSSVLVNSNSSKSANKSGKNGVSSFGKQNDNSGSSSYHNNNTGAKLHSPKKPPSKSTVSPSEIDSKVFNNQIPYPINSAMCISSLPPQEQEQFQRQTMSKAISYTINSLLSNPGSNEIGNRNSILKPNIDVTHSSSSSSKSSKSEKGKHGKNFSNDTRKQELPQGLFGIRGDQDQNSFLRHLLDTSDPIPAAAPKPEKVSSAKQARPSPTTASTTSSSNRNSTTSSNNNIKNKSSNNDTQGAACDLRKSSSTTHKSVANSSKSSSSVAPSSSSSSLNLNNHHHQFGQYPPFMHPNLVNSGFPLSLSAYDSLLRGQDPSSSALAAAAAAFQYQSLIPANILSNLNSTMAAAMAASYLGATPNNNIPPPGNSSSSHSSSRSPVNQSISPINFSGGSSSSPLNLSQRAWQGMTANGLIPGSATIPIPFHAPLGDNNLHSISGSANRHGYSRGGRLDKDTSDTTDVPLNLSKKSKPS